MMSPIRGRPAPQPVVRTLAFERKQSAPALARSQRFDLAPHTVEPERAPTIQGSAIRRILTGVEQQREEIDRAIRQAARGKRFSPTELLILQGKVFAFSETMEILSHLVDRTVGAVKTTLNTQV